MSNANFQSLIDSQKQHDYITELFPPPKTFQINQHVMVFQKRTPFSKAIIVGPLETDKSKQFYGRHKVLYPDNSLYHVRPERMVPLYDKKRRVLVCESTSTYRVVAKCVEVDDNVLEIGSDFGYTTNLISKYCKGKIIGIDKSEEHVKEAKKRYPHLQFEALDVFKDPEKMKKIADGCNKVFIDINGNRPLDAVLECTELVKKWLKPQMIVVKSIEMTQLLKKSS